MPRIDPALLGRVFDESEFGPVTADELVAFARALGETSPCYVEPGPELRAHPTFCVKFRGRKGFPDGFPAELRGPMSFDAGKDVTLGVPIRPGDTVRVASSVHDVYEKTGRSGGMTFVVVRFTMTNQHGEQVAVIDNRLMYRS
ncbi:MAG TPA: MaoC family dehydratase N-terminal domain-containing protein [Candidatus Limnocylindria bacterium]|nr:MaoC family dehydratase N-terminal domain-containing protein [Candidatus Limnocylindria bacterium]